MSANNSPSSPQNPPANSNKGTNQPEIIASGNKKFFSWPYMVSGAVGLTVLVALGATAGAYSRFASDNHIAPNVFIGGVPVGGLTAEEAATKLEAQYGNPQFTLETGGKEQQMTLQELGGTPGIHATIVKAYSFGREGSPVSNFIGVYGSKTNEKRYMLPIQWNKDQLVTTLTLLNDKFKTEPVNARLQAGDAGLEIVPERVGEEINIGETAKIIQSKYYIGLKDVTGATREVEPKVKSADLNGVDVKLGEYRTRFNPGLVGRTTNIRVACGRIDSHVLMPGDKFSFNGMTGERTWEKGYRMAHIFETKPGASEAEVVDGLAGGVCQVSSTLYNAVRKTNAKFENNPLKITERNTHSLPVTYVPPGADATVAWPYKDFRFKNVYDYPVFIRTSLGVRNLTISMWARVPEGTSIKELQDEKETAAE